MALSVLVVDDSVVMRRMIKKSLEMSGVEIGESIEASNGQEGLDALDERWVDFVIVDINMPVMDGEEMINRVRQRPDIGDLPIVVISTEGSQTRIERLEREDIQFIHKPFSPERFAEVIQQIAGGSNGKHES